MTSPMPRAARKPGSRSCPPSPWVALALLASAQLMLVLDVTVVNVALPDIGAALHLQRGELPWVMMSYTVFFGGLMLLGGRIADVFGARRMTLGGLALFTAASLLCGLSGDAATLLAGRSLQGLGAAHGTRRAGELLPARPHRRREPAVRGGSQPAPRRHHGRTAPGVQHRPGTGHGRLALR
jgi:MFS family permease